MQHHSSTPFPPPDVHATPNAPSSRPSSTRADFLVIGLFALRLAQRLIQGLDDYPGRDADNAWLNNFLAPFHHEYALAKISGARKEDYLRRYPQIVSRMKRQPRYPMSFMQLKTSQSRLEHRSNASQGPSEMSDTERTKLIDFVDAASEWGSVVPIPAHEADRMIALANQRRIADLDADHCSDQTRESEHRHFPS